MVIRGRAPLRISFGGGGTDVEQMCIRDRCGYDEKDILSERSLNNRIRNSKTGEYAFIVCDCISGIVCFRRRSKSAGFIVVDSRHICGISGCAGIYSVFCLHYGLFKRYGIYLSLIHL